MLKDIYISPEAEAIRLDMTQNLLSGSDDTSEDSLGIMDVNPIFDELIFF